MLVPLFTFRRFAGFPFIFGVVGGTFYHGAVFAYISFTGYFDFSHFFLSSFAAAVFYNNCAITLARALSLAARPL
jgi:hypothetical protein